MLLKAQLAEGHDKFLGNVIGGSIPSDFVEYWNQVTPENSGKWGVAEPTQDSYNWGGLDNMYNFAKANNFPYKHHTLIWGQQFPYWIAYLADSMKVQEIEEWFQLVGQRYPEMDFVDVVNEPLHAPPEYFIDAMGGSGATSWDWVIWAFEKAREYMPSSAKLILNDYNIINDNGNTNSLITIINLLKERNLIDAIGIQGHYFELRGAPVAGLKANLDKLAATGLPIYISEFEIDEANDETQKQKYTTIFPVLWEHPGVKGITLWGYLQGQIWKQNGYLVRNDHSERPALVWLRDYLSSTVDVKETENSLLENFTLYQNYPNPFNPSTTIGLSLPEAMNAKVVVYNLLGKEVATIIDERLKAGDYSFEWNAFDCPSGMYIYKLLINGEAGNFVMSKKMMLVK